MQIKQIYSIKIYRNCLKIRKNDQVQKNVKNASKIWLRNGTKNNNTCSHMLLDHCYAFSLLLKPSGLNKKFLKERDPPGDLFRPRPGSAPGRNWPIYNNTCKEPLVLHPYQVSLISNKRFCSKGWLCVPIHAPPFLHLNKFIKKKLIKNLKAFHLYTSLFPLH